MSKKHKNLQPWLDYFGLLQTYEQKGFLEVKADKHEAYVTRAALLTLAGITPDDVQSAAVSQQLTDTVRRLRTYAAFRAQQGADYLAQNFALHVVHDDPPHDPLLTLLLSLKNRHIGRKTDHIEVISYVEEKEDNV
mgnify:CR=1 FL=1